MSQRTERLTERLSLDSASEYIEAWYHIPLLLALAGFMFWIRARNWKNFVIDGRVYFSANDPWYHLRQVRYTVRHWPWTMPFDPWTSFPTGTSVGQFGTLYDQIVATVALIVGLGDPSAKTTALVLLFAPAVLGTLVVIPTYFLCKRFGGRFGGVIGVAVLALSPTHFLFRSVVGFSDHHIAEVLFQSLAVVAIVVALAVAEREKPIYEQFAERDFDNLRRPVGWAALAGFAITVYIWTWPPGLLLVGIFGVFILVSLPLQYLRGESPEHIAIVSAVALSVAGVLMLLTFKTFEISTTNFSILHPVLALVGAAGCVFLAWLARAVESRDLPALAYPGIIVGLFVASVLVVYVALPTVFDFFIGQLSRIIGFGTGKAALTVGEIKPPFTVGAPLDKAINQVLNFFYRSYGLAYIAAAIGALIMLVRLALGRTEKWATMLFVLVWTAFMTSATLTQARFNYYLVVPVAVLSAYFIGEILRLVGAWDIGTNFRDLEVYQVLAVAMAVLLVVAPLAFLGSAGPIAFLMGGPLTHASAAANGQTAGPGPVLGWDGSLQWLQNNTPAVGQYNGSQSDGLEYYGTFHPKDNDFNYTDGSYGILSWWDYGHWITVLGHRPPVANPFQQHVPMVANFLLATNTTVANNIVQTGDGEGIQYVMISWEMATASIPQLRTGILFAPFAWETKWGVEYPDDALSPIVTPRNGNLLTVFYAHEQRYYESMRTRLYAFHGSEIEPEPVVLDYKNPVYTANGSLQYAFFPKNTSVVKHFPNMSAAREFVEQDGSAQIGGVGRYPHERVPALKHYRLVHAAKRSAFQGPFRQVALRRLKLTGLNATGLFPTSMNWVKTFERVPGAKVVGHGPPNATIEATVEMSMPHSNATFNYTQQATTNAQGRFTMILPYSTTGYEKWGVERGATNVSVRATGPYTFHTVEGPSDGTTWTATAEVPEGMVIGRVDGPIRVTLTKQPVSTGTNTSTNTSTTAGNATVANGTPTTETGSPNTTGSNATPTNATATNANQSLVVDARRLAVTSRQGYTA